MTPYSYYFAWLVYFLSASGVCLISWQLLKPRLPRPAYVLLAPMLVLLLTPYFSEPTQSHLAPAILTCLFEGLFGDPQIARGAGMALLTLLLPTLVVVLILQRKQQHPSP